MKSIHWERKPTVRYGDLASKPDSALAAPTTIYEIAGAMNRSLGYGA